MRRLLLPVVIVSVGWLILGVAGPSARRLTNGYSAYYTAARLLREGAPVARFYDDQWFRDQTIRFGFERAPDIYNLNPPAASLLFWPLATLDPSGARLVWTGLNLAFLALAVGLIGGLFRGQTTGRSIYSGFGMTLAAMAVFQPVDENIRQGQAYLLLLVVEVVFALAYLSRRDRIAGMALAGLLAFKSAGLGFPLMLVTQRRWQAAAWTIVGGCAVIGATTLLFGADPWITYAGLVINAGTHHEIAVTAYQSIPGLIAHLFRFDPQWNPRPVLDVPGLVAPLTAGAVLALVGFTAWRTWRASSHRPARAPLAVAAWSVLNIALSPASADYHYTLAVISIALILVGLVGPGPLDRLSLAILVIAIVAIGAPWPQRIFASSDGFRALLAYPRLYGAILLWGLSVHLLARPYDRPAAFQDADM